MRRLIAALVLLAGCAAPPPPPETFRDPSVPIASTTRFDAARFAGRWTTVAAFAPEDGCADLVLEREGGSAYRLLPCGEGPGTALAIAAYGRLVPEAGAPLWVLWVDEGFRTAVVGTPDGSFGWIMNRGPAIPADRLGAAREVLAFNGYDLSRLTAVP